MVASPASGSDRVHVLKSAAEALASAAWVPAFVGFDGFVDLILRPVASRRSMAPKEFTPIATMSDFAARVEAAAGKSANIESVLMEARFGGNGPLMAGALARLGLKVTYAGAIGSAAAVNSPTDPLFAAFAGWCERVVTLGMPSTTSCYEFDDGKLMLNDRSNVQAVTWSGLIDAMGKPGLLAALANSRLLGVVNWSLLGGMQGILEGLAREALPSLPRHAKGDRRVFVDLADPTPRSAEDLRGCLSVLTEMNRVPGVAVTLGLNLAESEIVASTLGVDAVYAAAAPHERTGRVVAEAARAIREALSLDAVVIHPREGAGAAMIQRGGGNEEVVSAWFDGPLCEKPRLSTGAGDHFNAGFAVAQCVGLPIAECLAVGTATSGVYVRDAESPTAARVSEFLRAQAAGKVSE